MLSPSELRERGESHRRTRTMIGPSAYQQSEKDVTLAELCEQVAELREHRDAFRSTPLSGNPTVTIKPAPRILKAGEITEPGWYFRRDVGQDGDYYDPVDIRMYPCNAPHDEQSLHFYGQHVGKWLPLQLQIESEQFYGPIQLPE